MDAYEIVRRLDEWVRHVMIDQRTGIPLDAKFDIQPSSSSSFVAREGERSGSSLRTRGFNLDFRFAPHEPDESVEVVETRLRQALRSDPSLGGRFEAGDVELTDGRPLINPDDPTVRGVTVRALIHQREP